MTTKFYREFVRPNLGVEFPADPAEFTQYATDTYVSTGQCLQHRIASYSEDNLTKTNISVWATAEIFDATLSDVEYLKNQDFLTQYCSVNEIAMRTWIE